MGLGARPGVESGAKAGRGGGEGGVETQRAEGTKGGSGLSPGSQVLFNLGAAQCRLGLWAEATRSLEEALSKGSEGARDHLCTALDQVQVREGQGGKQVVPTPWGCWSHSPPCRAHIYTGPQDFLEGGGPCAQVWGLGKDFP